MTKRELVMAVAQRLGYTQNEVATIVQAMLDSVVESLAEGNRLEIRNFGVFEIKQRDSRIGRNPRTGQEVPIEQKRVATFKPGKALKEMVQARLDAIESQTTANTDQLAKKPGSAQSGSAAFARTVTAPPASEDDSSEPETACEPSQQTFW